MSGPCERHATLAGIHQGKSLALIAREGLEQRPPMSETGINEALFDRVANSFRLIS
jgi:hypothetical protein